jgi:hypothetical protein
MSNHIFICYARKDQSFVLRLAAGLKARGVPVWLDQWDIPAGADWNQSIDSALSMCGQFLIVLSPAAVASQQVRGELQIALDEHKPIVPVLRQACQMPRLLRLIQHIDFVGCAPDDVAALDRLVGALHMPEASSRLPADEPMKSQSRRRLWRYGTVGVLLVLGLLLGWSLWQPTFQPTNDPDQPAPVNASQSLPTPPTRPGPRSVPVHISTHPPGLVVYQKDHPDPVATTPWKFNAIVGETIKAVLKGEGYKDMEISFQVYEHESWNDHVYTPEKSSRR